MKSSHLVLTLAVVLFIVEGFPGPSGFSPFNNPLYSDNSTITSLSMSENGTILVEGDAGGYMRIFFNYNRYTYETPPISFHDASSPLYVAISSDGRKIIAAETNKTIRVYECIKGYFKIIQTIQESDQIGSLVFKLDGKKFAVGLSTGIIDFFDFSNQQYQFVKQKKSLNAITGQQIQNPSPHSHRLLVTEPNSINSLAVTTPFTYLIAATTTNAYLYQLQSTGWVLLTTIPSTSTINSVSITNDLTIAVGTSASLNIYNFQPATSSLQTILSSGFASSINSVLFSTNAQLLYVGQGSSVLVLQDPASTFTLIDTLNIALQSITSIATSQSGGILVFGSQDKNIYQFYKCVVSNCANCSTTLRNNCMTCNTGFNISLNGKCICSILNQTISQTTQLCVSCNVINCAQCNTPNVCVSCLKGFNQSLSNTSQVICGCSNLCKTCQQGSYTLCASCQVGFYLENNLCMKCNSNCRTCISFKICTSCNSSLKLSKHKCVMV